MNESAEIGDAAAAEVEERPTLKTIARLAGLAVPTVSRALNDAPDIGDDTKRRVREIANRIGYRPNRAGVRLRTGKTNVISLVLSTEHDMMNQTARLISSIAGELRGTPYHLIVTPYFPTEDPMDPIRYIVETGSADGIIMNQTEPRDPRVAYLMERDFPFATHGRTDWTHPYADFDNEAFAEIAVEAMVRRGRRRIGLLRPVFSHSYSIHLDRGMRNAAERLGVEAIVFDGATAHEPSPVIEEALRRHLAGPAPCDGFIMPTVVAAMVAVNVAEDRGLVVGRDFDVVAKEAIAFLGRFRKGILTVHEDVNTTGAFLARAVMSRIANPKAPPMQRLDVPERSELGL